MAHYHMRFIYAHVWAAFLLCRGKRSAAVIEHHVTASYWAGMLAWYYATGLVET